MSEVERTATDQGAAYGRVTVREHRVEDIPLSDHHWSHLSREDRLLWLSCLEPYREHRTENTICIGSHERVVDSFNGASPQPPPARTVVVGKGGATPAESDRSLSDFVAEVPIVESNDMGGSIILTTTLSNTEANVNVEAGEALREVGTIAGGVNGEDRYFLNHSLFAQPIEKNETIEATISIQLIYDSA